jgi:histidine triad (HIT) family protein
MSYDNNNVFAKMLRNEIPCSRVYEDDYCLAFHDLHPSAPIHILVIPKGPYVSFDSFCKNSTSDQISNFFKGVSNVIASLNLVNGYRIITNSGTDGCQTVGHFHIHILAGERLGPLVVQDNHHK